MAAALGGLRIYSTTETAEDAEMEWILQYKNQNAKF
jgi:hypothetical protein